jgi:cytochrome c-type biogenesis protein
MKDFFVNQVLNGMLVAAFPISVVAGLISFFSPCVLPLVPGYLSFAAGISKSRGRVFAGSLLFVSGFTAVFVSYGALFGGLGSKILVHQRVITQVLGVVMIIMGLIFMGNFPMMPIYKPKISVVSGLVGAPILGFLFGVGWTPCIGPVLAMVLTLAFEQASALRGATLSLGYCIGLGIPFVLTGLFLDRSAKLRRFISRRGGIITNVGGGLLIFIGLMQVLGLWSHYMNSLRSLISNFIPVV